MTAEFQVAFDEALKLHRQGDNTAAEEAYNRLLTRGENRELVLRSLVELYAQSQRPIETINTLKALLEEVPDSLLYCDRLAGVLVGLGQVGTAIVHYQDFIRRNPANANAYFNLALLYKRGKRFTEALTSYEFALAHDVKGKEEVYSNMAVLYSDMRQPARAREMCERALEINSEYIPALFNLAGLLEELGDREGAKEFYEKILSLDPQHFESLSRLAYAGKVSSADNELLESLRQASESESDDLFGKESIYFALGKAHDDLGQYEKAFNAYMEANRLGKQRNPPYRQADVEQVFDKLIEVFSAERMRAISASAESAPVFICGMFRSGSTLVEQILGSHAAVTAGGELDYLQWLVVQKLSPFPERMPAVSDSELSEVGDEYLSMVHKLFPAASLVTDKQPDNFIYLGLIKLLFPAAKIIFTRRQPLDNCLSIYFQQLGGNLNYATALENIAHYYRQHQRLMEHWLRCFPDNIHTVEYDELVDSPKPVVESLLEFLELEWDDNCLAFQDSTNPVRTASLWQVREELHTRSSGRWRNYTPFIKGIESILA